MYDSVILLVQTKAVNMDTKTQELILDLIMIKKSIIKNAPDVLFMHNSNETVCERIDEILESYGVNAKELEKHYLGEF